MGDTPDYTLNLHNVALCNIVAHLSCIMKPYGTGALINSNFTVCQGF